MSKMSEDIWYAGSDARPPMLDRTDFESWQQRIRLYCLGKDNGENIMKSITEGPFQMGTFIQTPAEDAEETEGALQLGPERARVFTDLSAKEKERYKADIRATNILLQGIPKDIYTLINHYTDAKDIWDNVKMILEGSELTKDDRESQLYDEFERFRQIKGETIHVYYVRFSKLINDMRNIKMTMSRMQLNSKFGQSAQTVHMLCQPKSFYDEKHKVAIGYKKHAQSAVYNGHMPVTTNHTPTVIHDSEDTLTTVVNAPIVSTNTSVSTTIAQDAPSTSHSLSSLQVHPPVFPQGVADGPTIKDTSITQADLHPSVNPVVGEPGSAQSTSGDVSLAEPNQVNQPPDHLRK
ncbi:hypothetical protein Tco_0803843 [Tanacetum coccineum]|uniref:Integrase, catalytic region, zinc finger, CCHC-type, peptidase aspartic, catalytic n=1 Tax=Tanacetum coccineum TaxID=301880 RepID=A0ABQ5A3N0_9ASTR